LELHYEKLATMPPTRELGGKSFVTICPLCMKPVPLFARLRGHSACSDCRDQARERFKNLVSAIAENRANPKLAEPQLENLAREGEIQATEQTAIRTAVFTGLVEQLISGGILSEEKERLLVAAGEAIKIRPEMLLKADGDLPDLIVKLIVARANANRLDDIPNPQILLHADERAHLQSSAILMEESRIRQYSGVSVRIMKGVYCHVGQSQPLTSTSPADSGTLTVTSLRVVYTGAKRSIEILYPKLLAVSVFSDGVEFNVSNRKAAPLFKLQRKGLGQVIAAIVTAAVRITPDDAPKRRRVTVR
jgi:hypothetical protein